MKKHLLAFSITALLVFGILTGIPYFVDQNSTRQTISDYIQSTYGVEIETDSLHWSWLPAPHLSIYGVKLTYKGGLICTLPQLRMYPDWEKIFFGKIHPLRLDFQRPHFVVTPTLFRKGLVALPPLPSTDIHMEQASLDLDSPALGNIPALSLNLTGGDFELKRLAGRLYLTMEAQTSCAEKISAKGWYNLLTKHYSASTKLEDFRLHKLIHSDSNLFSPLASTADMQWSCRGVLGQEFKVSFQGNIPDFTLYRDKGDEDHVPPRAQTDFRFREADFDLERNEDGIFFTARNISLAQPDCSLAGTVYRMEDSGRPIYQLDLKGSQIDLDGVRRSLLDILGDNKTTGVVCDIVQGGRAAEATYRFKGEVADFHDIRNMEIGVDVTTSEIVVPGVNLHLERTRGPILIDEGVLTGKGLKTSLGNSLGDNATLAVGLSHDKDLFRLEIDLDADISELPNVLFHLIDEQHFRQEIKKFQGRGRARGHLSMGDTLTDFQTGVTLKDGSEAVISYDRVYWPIIFKKGGIFVGRDVEIRDCSLESGPHKIRNISGSFSWQQGNIPRLDITEATASLDSADLLSHLRKYPKLKKNIDSHLTFIRGNLEVADSRLSGPLLRPKEWKYLLNLELHGNRITTPHLKGGLNIESARLRLQEEHLLLEESDIRYLQSPLRIRAEYDHNLLREWKGTLSLSGFMNMALADWLRQYTGLPPSFIPATPCKIDRFKMGGSGDKRDLQGRISRKMEDGDVVSLDFSLGTNASKIQQLQIKFTTPANEAVLTLQRFADQDKTALDWQGTLQGGTMTTLFAEPFLHIGNLQGNFRSVFLSTPGILKTDGSLKASDIRWKDLPPYTVIKGIHLTGTGRLLTIENLDLTYNGEKAEVTGDIKFLDRKPEMRLALSSSFLSRNNVADFAAELLAVREKITDLFPAGHERIAFESSIEVDCNTFMFSIPGKQDGKAKTLIINPLKGRAHSTEQGFMFRLNKAGFCGLDLDGDLSLSGDQFQIREIQGSNPANQIVRFENTLPCLGIQDSIIQGSFTTDFFLNKEDHTYRNGQIIVHSSNGKILKWGLLAKIFQVVNITDLGKFSGGSGFNYDTLTGEGHITDNILIIDKAELKGHGLDLLGRGEINLEKMSMDITVFLVPFKTIDAILNKIPLVGRLIQGREGHIITIPIGVKGSVADPTVTTLPPKAVGQGAINFIRDTISFPLDIIPGQEKQ